MWVLFALKVNVNSTQNILRGKKRRPIRPYHFHIYYLFLSAHTKYGCVPTFGLRTHAAKKNPKNETHFKCKHYSIQRLNERHKSRTGARYEFKYTTRHRNGLWSFLSLLCLLFVSSLCCCYSLARWQQREKKGPNTWKKGDWHKRWRARRFYGGREHD